MQLCQNFCSKVQSEGKGPKADISQQYDLHNIDCLLFGIFCQYCELI